MKDKYLPIGTVVLLKNGKKEVMICSYGIMPQGDIIENGETKNGEKRFFDYGGCTYPEGLINSEHIVAFNHEQIEKICYMGYETDEYKSFNKTIKDIYEQVKKELTNK